MRRRASSNGMGARSFFFWVVVMTQKPKYSDLCKAIGHIVLNWAAAEQSLDMCVTIVFKYCGGNKLRDDLPRSFNLKARFMREALRKLDLLKPLAAFGLPIIDQMDALSKTRHEMVHGALTTGELINNVWHFLKFDYGTDIHTCRDVSFSIDDFQDFGKKMQGLGEGLILLTSRLQRHAPRPK